MNNHFAEVVGRAVCGHPGAIALLEGIVKALHLWDDLIDADKPLSDDDVNRAFWFMLIDLPRNQFYSDNFYLLNPILMVAIQNWHAANKMERHGDDDDKRIAFILRSSYVDLITQSALITGGAAWAETITPEIRRFTHSEGYPAYLENLRIETEARGARHEITQ